MGLETAARTDAGRARDHNEDSVAVADLDGGTLLAVADGMGGHRAGDVASEVALEAFTESVADALDADGDGNSDGTGDRGGDAGGDGIAAALAAAVRDADAAVVERGADDGDGHGMGTTLVAAHVADGTVTVVNVGDSRAYHVTAGAIEQVTVDHSLVRELVESGAISPAEAETHPQRNVVSQALGTGDGVDPDTFDRPLDGTVLLCSDGLPEEVPESEIREAVADGGDLAAVADDLVDRANEYGGSDNVSVVLAR